MVHKMLLYMTYDTRLFTEFYVLVNILLMYICILYIQLLLSSKFKK